MGTPTNGSGHSGGVGIIDLDVKESQSFRNSLFRLLQFKFRDDEASISTLSLVLDELVAVDSSSAVFENTYEASELLGRLCATVPHRFDKLVAKLCQLVCFLIYQCKVAVTTPDLHRVTQFLIQGVLECPSYTHVDLLGALTAVCESNTNRLQKFHDDLLGGQGILLQLTDDTAHQEEVVVEAVRCLEALTRITPGDADCIEVRYLSACFDTFLHLLHRAPHMTKVSTLQSKLLVHCFYGIQNIFSLKRLPNIELGILFAAVRAYMFYGLTSHPPNIPSQLFPNVVAPSDPLASSKARFSHQANADSKEPFKYERSQGAEGKAASGGKSKKSKKKKGVKGREEGENHQPSNSSTGRMRDDDLSGAASLYPAWSTKTDDLTWEMTSMKISSSESEFSDTEGGLARRQKFESIKVRHAALTCYLSIVRLVDKKVMFGYWSSFLPDYDVNASSRAQTQSLFTTILKDPSPKCRLAALISLTSMLESTRPYLAVAEDLNQHQSAFTPFSVVLGNMIKATHRCLMQALAAESYKILLTQVIKCTSSLVTNVSYHRLQPGLLTRVIKQNRHFINHTDPVVRTAALTLIGAVVGSKPPLMEVSALIKPPHPPVGVGRTSGNPVADNLLYSGLEEDTLSNSESKSADGVSEKSSVEKEGGELNSSDVTQKACQAQSGSLKEGLKEERSIVKDRSSHGDSLKEPGEKSSWNGHTQNLDGGGGDEGVRSGVGEGGGLGNKSQVPKDGVVIESLQKSSNEEDMDDSKRNFENIGDSLSEHNQRPDISADGLDLGPRRSGRTTSVSDGFSGDDRSEGSRTPLLGAGSSGFQTPVFSDQLLQSYASQTSWVIKVCLKSILGQPMSKGGKPKFEHLPVRIEALQVMTSLISNYFPVLRQSFHLMSSLVQSCFEDQEASIRLHGAKFLNELTQALQRDLRDASIAPTQVISADQIYEFWQLLLSGPLTSLLQPMEGGRGPSFDVSSNVRAAACECLPNIGEDIFSRLPMRRQALCVTLVLGMAREEDKLVRAAAVRALGIYVLYPSLKTDVSFVIDSSKAILASMGSPSNLVRFKASWSLANICDTLVANKQTGQTEFLEEFPDSLLLQLLQVSAACMRDCDKVSCNAARAAGNLLKYLPERCFLQTGALEAVDRAVAGLVKTVASGTMKVRWNSCYAASNAFQNQHFPRDKPWISQLLTALGKAVLSCANLKVRINAATALTAPADRSGYGTSETFTHMWSCLIGSLETGENINDFAEFKYKDNLLEHICGAVLHMMSLVQLTDLSTLAPVVHSKAMSFRLYLEKYITMTASKPDPPGVPSVAEVRAHINSLPVTTDDHRRCQQALLQLFAPDLDSSEDRSPEKINFQQTYD